MMSSQQGRERQNKEDNNKHFHFFFFILKLFIHGSPVSITDFQGAVPKTLQIKNLQVIHNNGKKKLITIRIYTIKN